MRKNLIKKFNVTFLQLILRVRVKSRCKCQYRTFLEKIENVKKIHIILSAGYAYSKTQKKKSRITSVRLFIPKVGEIGLIPLWHMLFLVRCNWVLFRFRTFSFQVKKEIMSDEERFRCICGEAHNPEKFVLLNIIIKSLVH